MSIVNLLILILIVLVIIYVRRRFRLAGRILNICLIGGIVLLVVYLILLFTGSPLLYEYFEYGRCSGWCWGPKNEKGEYTILYTEFGSKMRHLKGAGMFGYRKLGYFSDMWQVNVDGSDRKKLVALENIKFGISNYCHKTDEVIGWSDRSGIWVAKFDGSNERLVLPTPPGEIIRLVQFSPDGKLIAYISYDEAEDKRYLWLLDVEGKWRKRLCRTEMVAWHPSGKYLTDGGGIIDLEGREVCHFPVGIPRPSFSPDGGYLVGYTQMLRIKREIKDGKEVWKAERIIAPGANKFPRWSPCGRYIINGWEGGIRLVDLLIGTTIVSLTPGQIIDPGHAKGEGEDLAKFRSYIKKNDPQWWNNMVDKFPNLNLEYVK